LPQHNKDLFVPHFLQSFFTDHLRTQFLLQFHYGPGHGHLASEKKVNRAALCHFSPRWQGEVESIIGEIIGVISFNSLQSRVKSSVNSYGEREQTHDRKSQKLIAQLSRKLKGKTMSRGRIQYFFI
jgi:hypothetical protein